MYQNTGVGGGRVCFKINNQGNMPRALLIRLDTFYFVSVSKRTIDGFKLLLPCSWFRRMSLTFSFFKMEKKLVCFNNLTKGCDERGIKKIIASGGKNTPA
jgi:hypothetical protein